MYECMHACMYVCVYIYIYRIIYIADMRTLLKPRLFNSEVEKVAEA